MSVIKSVMILETYCAECYTISLDRYNKTPYNKTCWSQIINNPSQLTIRKGDIFDVEHVYVRNGMIWTKKADYKDHNYEYAVVQGQQDNKLFVYGNKVELLELDTSEAMYQTSLVLVGLQPGDRVLLQKYPHRNKYFVVHNITHAQRIYDVQQNGPKIR